MDGCELLPNEEFKQIVGYPKYWVSNQGRVWSQKRKIILVGGFDKDGYHLVSLYNEGRKSTHKVHQLVMREFGAPCPADCDMIDHINHIRDDNRIENLRWSNNSLNQKNVSEHKGIVYEYFDEIPCDSADDIVEVEDYGEHQFKDYYYAKGYFYFDTQVNFKRLHVSHTSNGLPFVRMRDTDNKLVNVFISKFERLYDLN